MARMRGIVSIRVKSPGFHVGPPPPRGLPSRHMQKGKLNFAFATFETRVQHKAVLVDRTVTPNHAGRPEEIFAARCRFATSRGLASRAIIVWRASWA
jgi:hypothetical protein